MARYGNPARPPRNTAPMWKKLTVVISVLVVEIVVISFLHANTWNFFLFLLVVLAVAVATVWGMSKLLGMRLTLRSWD